MVNGLVAVATRPVPQRSSGAKVGRAAIGYALTGASAALRGLSVDAVTLPTAALPWHL